MMDTLFGERGVSKSLFVVLAGLESELEAERGLKGSNRFDNGNFHPIAVKGEKV